MICGARTQAGEIGCDVLINISSRRLVGWLIQIYVRSVPDTR